MMLLFCVLSYSGYIGSKMVTSVQLVHFSVVFFLSVVSGVVAFSQPHVVVIVADDLVSSETWYICQG